MDEVETVDPKIELLKVCYAAVKSNSDLVDTAENYCSHTEEGLNPTAQDILHHLCCYPVNFCLDSLGPKFAGIHTWIPGQYLSSPDMGPDVNRLRFSKERAPVRKLLTKRPDIVVVGTAPSGVDVSEVRQVSKFDEQGPWTHLFNGLEINGVGRDRVFFTTASKFTKPEKSSTLPAKFATFCKPVLQFELAALDPKVIILLGSEACKSVLGQPLDKCRGRVETFLNSSVVCTANPTAFFYNTSGVEQFLLDMKTACDIANGESNTVTIDGINYPSRDYKSTQSVDELEEWVNESMDQTHFAIDFETGTDTGRDEDGYGITFQWSCGATHGRLFCLRGERGKVIHSSNDVVRYKSLFKKLLDRDNVVLIGHNLRYDVQYFQKEFDVDLFSNFYRYFDTMEAYHVLQLDKEKGLKHLTIKYTNMGAYDYPMKQWVDENSGTKGLKLFPGAEKKKFTHGFRDITYKYLIPYALCDVDATYRLYLKFSADLNKPENAKIRRLYYDICMPNHEFINEIEKNGIPASEQKLLDLSDTYQNKVLEIVDNLRKELKWPDFNPASIIHKNAFLFYGHKFNNHEKAMEAVPEGALTLGVEPLFNTGKKVVQWSTLDDEARCTNNPASDAANLKLLCQDDTLKNHPARKALGLLKDLSAITQFSKTFLAKPVLNEDLRPSANDTEWIGAIESLDNILPPTIMSVREELKEKYAKGTPDRLRLAQQAEDEGLKLSQLFKNVINVEYTKRYKAYEQEVATLTNKLNSVKRTAVVYNKGLISCIRSDGRVATRIDTMSETGRMKHRDPNLANLPKGKEGNIEKVFGTKLPTVRSSFVARPGYVILEADYSAAEVWTMSYLGCDLDMLKLLKAGVDIHSANARRFFNVGLDLDDEEFKKQYKYKRAAAKGVIFSIAYGTQAPGLARRLSVEMGEEFPVEEAETAINAFYRVCAGIGGMLEEAKRSVLVNEFVETAWGRRRYFPGVSTLSREAKSAAQREGPNARIQGTVADCLNLAGTYLVQFGKKTKLGRACDFKIMNAIHDAILIEVPIVHVPFMCQLMRYCMSELVTIPCKVPNAKLEVDVEASDNWGGLKSVKDLVGYSLDHKTPFKEWCSLNKDLLPKEPKLIVA